MSARTPRAVGQSDAPAGRSRGSRPAPAAPAGRARPGGRPADRPRSPRQARGAPSMATGVSRSSSSAATNRSSERLRVDRRPARLVRLGRRRGPGAACRRRSASSVTTSSQAATVSGSHSSTSRYRTPERKSRSASGRYCLIRSWTNTMLPSDLLIFSPSIRSMPACIQNLRERPLAGPALGLGDLGLVVRVDQVAAAAVDVERLAEVADRHRGALDVPAGPAGAPGARPGRLAGLRGLPEQEVDRRLLAAGRRPGRRSRSAPPPSASGGRRLRQP